MPGRCRPVICLTGGGLGRNNGVDSKMACASWAQNLFWGPLGHSELLTCQPGVELGIFVGFFYGRLPVLSGPIWSFMHCPAYSIFCFLTPAPTQLSSLRAIPSADSFPGRHALKK